MTPTQTTAIAAALRLALQRSDHEPVTAEPEKGLYLQLSGVDGVLYLTLRREGAYPAHIEAQTWAEAFGIPDGTDSMSRRSWNSTHPKSHRPLRWYACTFAWREA